MSHVKSNFLNMIWQKTGFAIVHRSSKYLIEILTRMSSAKIAIRCLLLKKDNLFTLWKAKVLECSRTVASGTQNK